MEKKKAIKIVTATAIAASAFTAVAPAQSEAAVSVKSQVSASQKAMKKPYTTYTQSKSLASASVVKKQIAAAKSAQAKANTAIKNSKSSAKVKAGYYKQIKAYSVYITRAQGYVNAITLNTRAEEKALAAAIEGGNLEEIKAARATLNSNLYQFNKKVAKVYSTPIRNLLKSIYATPAKEVNAAAIKLIKEDQDDAKYAETLKAVTAKVEAYVAATADLKTQAQVDAAKAAKAAIDLKDIKDADKTALQTKIDTADKLVAAAEAALAVPAVESVSAINAKQIKVVFNKEVDKDLAQDETKYYVLRAGDLANVALNTADGTAVAELQADGKTVIITLTTSVTSSLTVVKDAPYNFIVDGVKTKEGAAIPKFTQTLINSDKVAPKFVSISASGKTSATNFTLKFDEPIDPSAATVTIDGKVASLTVGTGSKSNEVTATLSTGLAVGKTYNVTLLNFKDAAGNLLDPYKVDTTVNVVSDTNVPTVTDVKVVRDNLLEVTFDKDVDLTTLTSSNVKLFDGNGTAQTVGTIVYKDSSVSKKVVQVPVTATFTNDKFNGSVLFTTNVKDTAGNNLASTSKNVSFEKDTTKPTVVSAKYVKATSYGSVTTSNGAIVVEFSEEVNDAAGTITLTDDQGANVTYGTEAVNTKNKKELVIPLSSSVASTAKFYTVSTGAGAATDLSATANPSALSTQTVDVTAGGVVASDTSKPAVDTVVKAGGSNNITFNVSDAGTSGLDFTTVAAVNNYRLDGAPLPAGSYITVGAVVGGKYPVTINVPTGSISKDKSYSLNINGIKDKAGNTIDTVVTSGLALLDDVAPELNAATLNTNGSISLGFSEDMKLPSTLTGEEADFAVTLNGSLLTGTTKAYSFTDGTGSEAGKYILTVATKASNVADGAGIDGVAKNYLYVDVNGNGSYDAGTDLVVSSTIAVTGTGDDYTAGTYNLNNATTLKVGTAASTSVVKDASTTGIVVKANKEITVK